MSQRLSSSSDTDQLTLRFKAKREITFENYFLAPATSGLLDQIQTLLNPSETVGSKCRILYLWGESGVGKTHLLQAACYEQFLRKKRIIYIPLSNLRTQHPEEFMQAAILDGLHQGYWSLIAMDQFDQLITNSELENQIWLEELSYVLKNSQGHNFLFMFAGQSSFQTWPVSFQNLFASITESGCDWTTQELVSLKPFEKIQALQHLAKQSGMPLSESVADFLLATCHQELSKSLDALDHVMRVAYLQKKSVTLPFVKQLFQFN